MPTRNEEMVRKREEALRRLRSLHEHSVTSFQVIEIPRQDDDPPEGKLMLVLGDGEQLYSSWRTAIEPFPVTVGDAV
jgi:hypothetical protein